MQTKTVFNSYVTDIFTTDKEGVGQVRWVRENAASATGAGLKGYIFVRNSTGSTLVVGQSLYFGTLLPVRTSADQPTTYLEEVFTFGQSGKGTALSTLAGVAVSAIPDGSFGWIQFYGYNSTITVGGATGTGTNAIAALDRVMGLTGQIYFVKDTSPGTAPTAGRRGITVFALKSASSNSANVAGFIEAN